MRLRSLLIGLAVLAILLLVVGWLDRPGPAGASRDSPVPDQLAITVDNGHTRAHEGDVLTYTTRVRNDEPHRHQLQVTQMLPAALRVISANGDGQANTREVTWDVTLAPGQERLLRAVMEVGPSREGYRQLATTSCVGIPGQPPSICAEDTDPLVLTSTPGPNAGRLLLTVGIVLILAVGAVAVYAIGSEGPSPRGTSAPVLVGRVPAEGRAGRRAGSRDPAAIPARVADPLRAWTARISGMIAARVRVPRPAPSWFVRVRHGKARSPPAHEEVLTSIR